jgi:hypothetical protein
MVEIMLERQKQGELDDSDHGYMSAVSDTNMKRYCVHTSDHAGLYSYPNQHVEQRIRGTKTSAAF